jgi:hypothetical protein
MADADAPKDKLDQAIEEAANSAKESVASYAKLAKEANQRLGGGEPADTGAWLQLTARAYAQAASDAAKAWTTGYELLQALAEQAEPPTAEGGRVRPPAPDG